MAVEGDLHDDVAPAAELGQVLVTDQYAVGLHDQHVVLGGLLAQEVHNTGDQEDLAAGDLEQGHPERVVDAFVDQGQPAAQ